MPFFEPPENTLDPYQLELLASVFRQTWSEIVPRGYRLPQSQELRLKKEVSGRLCALALEKVRRGFLGGYPWRSRPRNSESENHEPALVRNFKAIPLVRDHCRETIQEAMFSFDLPRFIVFYGADAWYFAEKGR